MFSQFDNEDIAVYFDRLNAPLKKMPAAERAEIHQELRQHLDALIAAHEELGATPSEAVAAAVRQLGDPRRLGRRLFAEWHRTAYPGERQVVPAILTVLGIHFLALFSLFGVSATGGEIALPSWLAFSLLFTMTVMVPPIMAGTAAAWFFPKAGLKGVAIGHLCVPLLMFTLALFDMASGPQNSVSLSSLCGIVFAGGIWMMLGCGAAYMTGIARRRMRLLEIESRRSASH